MQMIDRIYDLQIFYKYRQVLIVLQNESKI